MIGGVATKNDTIIQRLNFVPERPALIIVDADIIIISTFFEL